MLRKIFEDDDVNVSVLKPGFVDNFLALRTSRGSSDTDSAESDDDDDEEEEAEEETSESGDPEVSLCIRSEPPKLEYSNNPQPVRCLPLLPRISGRAA
jgi:hypothetical protein